mmetsp:Transcript_54782/g.168825  ORF Transcript_54782/g.168825 Transcript_54782/m.168825 type:complete len:517 (-) Transcript_54782:42-1592(-)
MRWWCRRAAPPARRRRALLRTDVGVYLRDRPRLRRRQRRARRRGQRQVRERRVRLGDGGEARGLAVTELRVLTAQLGELRVTGSERLSGRGQHRAQLRSGGVVHVLLPAELRVVLHLHIADLRRVRHDGLREVGDARVEHRDLGVGLRGGGDGLTHEVLAVVFLLGLDAQQRHLEVRDFELACRVRLLQVVDCCFERRDLLVARRDAVRQRRDLEFELAGVVVPREVHGGLGLLHGAVGLEAHRLAVRRLHLRGLLDLADLGPPKLVLQRGDLLCLLHDLLLGAREDRLPRREGALLPQAAALGALALSEPVPNVALVVPHGVRLVAGSVAAAQLQEVAKRHAEVCQQLQRRRLRAGAGECAGIVDGVSPVSKIAKVLEAFSKAVSQDAESIRDGRPTEQAIALHPARALRHTVPGVSELRRHEGANVRLQGRPRGGASELLVFVVASGRNQRRRQCPHASVRLLRAGPGNARGGSRGRCVRCRGPGRQWHPLRHRRSSRTGIAWTRLRGIATRDG